MAVIKGMTKWLPLVFVLLFAINNPNHAQSFAPDSISIVKSEFKVGSLVSVKGDIIKTDEKLEITDNSGRILIDLGSLNDPSIYKGDHVTINGTLKFSEKGEIYILVRYYRKHKYVKDPAHCCMPDLD